MKYYKTAAGGYKTAASGYWRQFDEKIGIGRFFSPTTYTWRPFQYRRYPGDTQVPDTLILLRGLPLC